MPLFVDVDADSVDAKGCRRIICLSLSFKAFGLGLQV